MNPIDTLTFDWLGDTLFNVMLFNIALVGPASFAAGHAIALTWRPWNRLVFYAALLSAGLRFLDYALAGGELAFNTLSGLCPGLVFSTRSDHPAIVDRLYHAGVRAG